MQKRIQELKNIVLKHKSYRSPNAEIASVIAEEVAVALVNLRTKQAAHLVAEEARLDAYGKTIQQIHTMIHPESVAVKRLHLGAVDTSVLRLEAKNCECYEDFIALSAEMRARGLHSESDKLAPYIQAYKNSWMQDSKYQDMLSTLQSKAASMAAPNMILNGDIEDVNSAIARAGGMSFTPLQDFVEQAVAYDTTLTKMVLSKMDTVPMHNPLTPQFQQKLADLSKNMRITIPSVDSVLATMEPRAAVKFAEAADAVGLEHGPIPTPVLKKSSRAKPKSQAQLTPYVPDAKENTFGEAAE